MSPLVIYAATQMAIGLVAISVGTFLILARERWALVASRRAEAADGERLAELVRRKFLGWGVGLVVAGLLAVVFVVYTVVSR